MPGAHGRVARVGGVKGALRGYSDQVHVIALVLAICLVLAVVAAYWQSRRPEPPRLAAGALTLAMGWGLSIAVATLTARDEPPVHRPAQLRPLVTIRHYGELDNPPLTLVYVSGNVALFVPLGFFLFLALRRLGVRALAAAALVPVFTSLAVEVLQSGIRGRNADVDDVILNAFGGLCGALLGAVAWLLWHYGQRRVRRQVVAGTTAADAADICGAAALPETPVATVAAEPSRHPA
jgi:VanZ family protein